MKTFSTDVLILGAGLTGLSTSYHLGHKRCLILEKNSYAGGHIFSEQSNGFTWDEGPHVSFTNNEFVKDILAESVNGDYLEYPVQTISHFNGSWIPHPAQSHLYYVPEMLREKCIKDFLEQRKKTIPHHFENYHQWLNFMYGETFAQNFPAKYTKKYWTIDPYELTTDWIGPRMHIPDTNEILDGAKNPGPNSTHYVKKVRYPKTGGYYSYAGLFIGGANIEYSKEISSINLKKKAVYTRGGNKYQYSKIVNTLPLPLFINLCEAPEKIDSASKELSCSEVLLLNYEVDHPRLRDENWIYIYDEDKYATRLYNVDLMSPNNAPNGKTGIQVEVYFSDRKQMNHNAGFYLEKVKDELIEIGLIESAIHIANSFHRYVKYGNVIFDHKRKSALEGVFDWLEQYGLYRYSDEFNYSDNWENMERIDLDANSLFLAGRYGKWKYYWSDDCILNGNQFNDKRM